MSSIEIEVMVLKVSSIAVVFALNWLLQSTLLISIGLLAAWLYGQRGSAFQSVVYRTTLAAVLICPFVTFALSYSGIDGWSLNLPRTFVYEKVDRSEAPFDRGQTSVWRLDDERMPTDQLHEPAIGFDSSQPLQDEAGNHRAALSDSDSDVLAGQTLSSAAASVAAPIPDTQVNMNANLSSATEPTTSIAVSTQMAAETWLFEIFGFGLFAVAFTILWTAASAFLLVRLVYLVLRTNKLRAGSIAADIDELAICQQIAFDMNVATPQVLRAPYLTSPFLHGIRRPAVMLPEEGQLPLADVFVHELAHLQRHDCLWLLLRQIATTVLSFQPLLWLLARRIDSTAEEVCDDYVVQFGGNRESYANCLVDIAALNLEPVAMAGVGMVSLRSMLGQRVGRIMDTSRSLSTRVGNLLLVLVLGGGLIGTTIAGFVGLSPESSLAVAATPVQDESISGDEPDAASPVGERHSLTGESVTSSANNNKQANISTPESEKKATAANTPSAINGRVISHTGKAVAGARLYWYRTRVHDLDPMQPKRIATSAKDGAFSFTPPHVSNPDDEPAHWSFRDHIVVVADGHGFETTGTAVLRRQMEKPDSLPGAVARSLFAGGNVAKIELPSRGESLRGRIVNIEGQPISGVTVRIRNFTDADSAAGPFGRTRSNSPDTPPAQWQARVEAMLNTIEPVPQRFVLPTATTNANGEFELQNVGSNRLLQLLVEGDGIQTVDVIARNVEAKKFVIPENLNYATPAQTVYGNGFLYVAGPSNTVTGKVVDLDTQEPIPNAVVRAFTVHGERLYSTRERQHFATRTDKDGRYQISGLPIGNGNRLAAFGTGDIPWIPVGQKVDTSKAEPTIQADFTLKRGLWAEGQVIDGTTGKPFTGELSYYWFRDRSLEKAIPGLRLANVDGRYFTSRQGRFRVPVLPTRGLLAYRWDGAFEPGTTLSPIAEFPRGLGEASIKGKDERLNAFPTMPHYMHAGNYNFVAEISPEQGDERIKVEMSLRSSKPVQLQIVSSDVEADSNSGDIPMTGYTVYGLNERWGWKPDQTTQLVVEDLLPNRKRKVFVFHPKAGLAGAAVVDENVKQPVEIKLTKSGSLKGRLVDESGDPITDGTLSTDYEKLWGDEPYGIWMNGKDLHANPTQIPGDKQGRFELHGLIPGWKYSARVSAPRKMQGQMMRRGIGMAFVALEIQPGEFRDLGDLTVSVPSPNSRNKPTKENGTEKKPDAEPSPRTSTGFVSGPNNKPVADARVYVIGWPANRSTREFDVIAEAKTGADGSFTIDLGDSSGKSHRHPLLYVRKDELGVGWQKLNLDKPGVLDVVKLLEEGVIAGKMVDIEGQPIRGLTIQPEAVMDPSNGPSYENGASLAHDKTLSVTTDDQGCFAIRGIPVGHGVFLRIAGNDRVAPQSVALNTGMPEHRGDRDATYRSIVRNVKPDEDAVITLAPAQVFEGTIRYADTKQPVANSRISIWSSQQQFGSMMSVEGTTDDQGHYHISANPGIRFGIQAHAPVGTPYLNHNTPITEAIEWRAGDRIRRFDYELPRGVLVRGTISEEGTASPVAEAWVQYRPESVNNNNTSPEILTGWQAMQRSGTDGTFEISVHPGPGRLLIFTPGQAHILKHIGGRMISANKAGGTRNYAHAIERIDPEPGSKALDLKIVVKRGTRISGRIVNANGDAPKETIVISRLNIHPTSLFWRGHSDPVLDGRFELGAFEDGVEYKTHFLDSETKLGVTAVLTSADAEPTVTLQPCGTATAKFVDAEGQPVPNHRGANMFFILTPGVSRYDVKMMRRGLLAAESDFLVNVDRRNHANDSSDESGRVTYSALIPGATYELRVANAAVKSFTAESGKTIDLGEYTVKPTE